MQDPSLTSKPHLSVAASSALTRHCSECRVKKGESFKVLGTSVQFSSVQLLSCVQLFATPWTAASLSIINSRSLLKLMSIESMMSSNHIIFCHLFLFLPSWGHTKLTAMTAVAVAGANCECQQHRAPGFFFSKGWHQSYSLCPL